MRRPLLTLAACALALTACGGSPGEVTDAGPSAPDRPASVTESTHAEETSQAAPAPIAFAVTDGSRTQGPDTVEVAAGDTVSLEVTSDVADELHVHGYDEALDLTPGEPGRIEFTADIPGSFEVELHEQGLLLTQLRVSG